MRKIVMSFIKEDPLIGGSSCDRATRISQKARRSKGEKEEKDLIGDQIGHVPSL
jgi:hypothetical protein